MVKSKRKYRKNRKIKSKCKKLGRRKYSKKGGAVLGSGTFGCVISPAILCPGIKPSRNSVSKLSTLKLLRGDIATLERIGAIDPEGRYFPLMLGHCKVNRRLFSKENLDDYTKCFRTMRAKDGKMINYNMILSDGGESLQNIIFRKKTIGLRGSILAKTMRHNKVRTEITKLDIVPKMKRHLRQLLEGIELLHRNHITHNDIKLDNTVLSSSGFRIIDFGLAKSSENAQSIITPQDIVKFIGGGTPLYLPPEFYAIMELFNRGNMFQDYMDYYRMFFQDPSTTERTLLAWIVDKISIKSDDDIQTSYRNFVLLASYLTDLTKIFPTLKRKYTPKIKEYITHSEQLRAEMDVEQITQPDIPDTNLRNEFSIDVVHNHHYKKDIYAAGKTIEFMYNEIIKRTVLGVLEDKALLKDLFTNMITLNFWERFTIEQCLGHPYFA